MKPIHFPRDDLLRIIPFPSIQISIYFIFFSQNLHLFPKFFVPLHIIMEPAIIEDKLFEFEPF